MPVSGLRPVVVAANAVGVQIIAAALCQMAARLEWLLTICHSAAAVSGGASGILRASSGARGACRPS